MSIGLVYVIGAPNSGVVKIGRSVHLSKRFAQIQTGCPFEVEVRFSIEGAARLEGQLHAEFERFRTYGEWFDFGGLDPVAEVAAAVRRLQPRATSEAERQAMRRQLADLRLLRIESDALQKLATSETERLVINALNLGIGPSETARLAGITDGYVRGLRRKDCAKRAQPAPSQSDAGVLDDLGIVLP